MFNLLPHLPSGHRLAVLFITALLAVGVGRVAAQVQVTVDATTVVRKVDDRMFGINTALWDSSFKNVGTLPLLQAINPRIMRFPGGSSSDEYNWETLNSFKPGGGYDGNAWNVTFDDFAAAALALNSQAFITVNYGSDTADHAAAWVNYSNVVKKYGFKYWEVGNENYGSWELDNHPIQWDPVTYATVAKDYITKMKAVDPTIKVGLVVQTGEDNLDAKSPVHNVTNPRTGFIHHGWTPVMLTTLKGLGVIPDYVIYHRYEQSPGQESDAALLQKAASWPNDAKDLRQQLTDYLGAGSDAVELNVTENNSVYGDPGKQITSVVNGLYMADSLGNLLQTEFNSSVWWDLHNNQNTAFNNSPSLYGWRLYGDYGILSPSNDPYPNYYVFKLLTHFARGGDTVVKATSPDTKTAVFAVRRQDRTLTLLVINKNPTGTATVNFALTGFSPKATGTRYDYGIPQDEAARLGSGSPDVAQTTLTGVASNFTATFGAYSASVLVLVDALEAPPVLQNGPVSVTQVAGTSVSFTSTFTGDNLNYQWYKNGVAISGATQPNFSISSIQAGDAGDYTVTASNSSASVTSRFARLTVGVPVPSFIRNLSVRAAAGLDGAPLIVGLVVNGGSKQILVRAIGPTLTGLGVAGALADPALTFHDATSAIASNDNWGDNGAAAAMAAIFSDAGAFALSPTTSKDAALEVSSDGPRTAVVSSTVAGASGVVLVEVYDAQPASGRLINVSARGFAGTDSQSLIAGFVIDGTVPKRVLIHAVGPGLTKLGLSGALADPKLELHDVSKLIATNDNWGDEPNVVAATTSAGALVLADGSKDSAIYATLPAGAYTAVVTGANGTTGQALVEVYEVP